MYPSARSARGPQKWYEFSADQFTDEGLRMVADLPQLVELRVVSTSVGDQQLETLAQTSKLESLVLVSPRLRDECLPSVAALRNLNAGLLLGDGQFFRIRAATSYRFRAAQIACPEVQSY